MLAVGLAAATAGVVGAEGDWAEEDVALAATGVATIGTIGLWAAYKTHPQLIAIAGSLAALAMALSSRAGEDWIVTVLGLSFAGFGLVGLIATEVRVLVPRITARALSALGLAAGAFYAGLPPGPAAAELTALVVCVVLVVASIRLHTLLYLVFGMIAGFLGLVTVVLRHIDNPALAALALIATGIVLLAAIVYLHRRRPWERRGRPGHQQPPAPVAHQQGTE